MRLPFTELIIAAFLSALLPAAARGESLSCESDNDNFPQSLEVRLEGGKLTRFEYVGMTPALDPPHKYSCSLSAGRHDKSEWRENGDEIEIRLNDSADPDDLVRVTRSGETITFHFEAVSPMNCGHSSTIAESISLRKGAAECFDITMRD